ncbi:MAG: 8-amino-7-oxononanoate synthase [Aphanocapsa sp. GSE-SYN-MK-11-07L]|jgi:8-amino-7-oxononanoate synthase|nr:8-amino-7-oxononanoate synthase [Aphanocapsa sp. GSE-SYN-MK-11-07L]
MSSDPYGWIAESLAAIHKANWYRSPQPIAGRAGAKINLQGQLLLNFGSNDYLGLAADPRMIAAAIAATQEFGTGSTGSRLITGHRDLHRQLEQAIAQLKQTEDALVFSSGYLANLGAIAALVGKKDLILADHYNHSSLKTGAKLSGATVLDYSHLNLVDLAAHLEQERSAHRRCLILTDTVFSMDGDLCPLPELLAIAAEYDCMVLVDEAHATGVMGATGAGCVEQLGCSRQPLIQMGTLSKALGSLGGYIAGSAELIDYLRNRATSWIYTTGLSPADTAAALKAIAIVQQDPARRQQLWQNVGQIKQGLGQIFSQIRPDFKLLPSESPIVCIQMPNPASVLQASQSLRQDGIFAPAIRPPTVSTSRLRLTVMATHTPADCQYLLAHLTASFSSG